MEKDEEAKAIMKNAQDEEFKHFGMELEFLLRKKPAWREMMKTILFTEGDIVEKGKRQRIDSVNQAGLGCVHLKFNPCALCDTARIHKN